MKTHKIMKSLFGYVPTQKELVEDIVGLVCCIVVFAMTMFSIYIFG